MKDEVEKLLAQYGIYSSLKEARKDKALSNMVTPTLVPRLLDLFQKAQVEAVRAARIDENQMYLDRINNWKPKLGQLTAASFGSAGAALTESAWKHAFEDRLANLKEDGETK